VDVTDFGFAQTGADRLAYLVMEYLDGCTLGDVLAEEKRLPLEWVVDILDQVCSAVHEAHQQGVVHRDLKPDNIWLEPNRLGGYRVKVLDFGIAKLAEVNEADEVAAAALGNQSTFGRPHAATPASFAETLIPHPAGLATDLETATILKGNHQSAPVSGAEAYAADLAPTPASATPDSSGEETALSFESEQTRLFAPAVLGVTATSQPPTSQSGSDDSFNEFEGTRLLYQQTHRPDNRATAHSGTTASTAGLTRVGTIMGTPLYMSPEQCRGESLDARADIYSLGVIGYQMLAGAPPFTGDMTTVMRLHIECAPRPLREQARKLPKRVSRVIMSALAKNPSDRPQTAQAFANSLRANADSLGALYRRAFALYSEYFPKFLKLSLIAHIPVIAFTLLLVGWELTNRVLHPVGIKGRAIMFCILAVLWLGQVISYFLAASAISGLTAVIVTQIAAAPLRPVELRTAFALLKKRWRPFLNTSIRMTVRIILFSILGVIPGLVVTVRYALYAPVVLLEGLTKKAARVRARQLGSRSWRTVMSVLLLQFLIPAIVSGVISYLSGSAHRSSKGIHVEVSNQFSGLFNILVIPLMSIVPALLYLKMRQMGGEPLSDLVAQIEEVEAARSNWQQRMRTRLTSHAPARTPSGPKPN
jgi:serine/threonine protein kinase